MRLGVVELSAYSLAVAASYVGFLLGRGVLNYSGVAEVALCSEEQGAAARGGGVWARSFAVQMGQDNANQLFSSCFRILRGELAKAVPFSCSDLSCVGRRISRAGGTSLGKAVLLSSLDSDVVTDGAEGVGLVNKSGAARACFSG